MAQAMVMTVENRLAMQSVLLLSSLNSSSLALYFSLLLLATISSLVLIFKDRYLFLNKDYTRTYTYIKIKINKMAWYDTLSRYLDVMFGTTLHFVLTLAL